MFNPCAAAVVAVTTVAAGYAFVMAVIAIVFPISADNSKVKLSEPVCVTLKSPLYDAGYVALLLMLTKSPVL